MDKEVELSTNWYLLRGKNISESLVIRDVENIENIVENERCCIDDIVSFEQSIHLQQPQRKEDGENFTSPKKESCELYFKINDNIIPISFSLVTDCQTLELFINIHKEYSNTYFGEIIDDFDGMRVYRYDLDIASGVTQFCIKFIPRVPEIWIYGVRINIKSVQIKKEKSIVESTGSCINNIDLIQSSSQLKLELNQSKSFIENFLKKKLTNQFVNLRKETELKNLPLELQNFQELLNISRTNTPIPTNTNNKQEVFDKEKELEENMEITDAKELQNIKEYIDKAVLHLENKIKLRLEDLEKRQNEKLDQIIKIISK